MNEQDTVEPQVHAKQGKAITLLFALGMWSAAIPSFALMVSMLHATFGTWGSHPLDHHPLGNTSLLALMIFCPLVAWITILAIGYSVRYWKLFLKE